MEREQDDKERIESIYDLRISLIHSDPEIWRLVRCSGQLTLDGVHRLIQQVMDWEDDHLHYFQVGKEKIRYCCTSTPMGDWILLDEDEEDEEAFSLAEVLPRARMKMLYLYDYGDSWKHEIRVEKVHRGMDAAVLDKPRCLDGACASPPDDCGGIGGYYHMLQVWTEAGKPADNGDLFFGGQWFPEDFDPDIFDLDAANEKLAAL